MKLYSNKERDALLDSYLNMYGDAYTSDDVKKLKDQFLRSYVDSITQVYSALGMMDDEENPYVGFTHLIEKLYGLDINILEVGGGIYPALSKEIAKRQASIGKGSITVMDPLLSKNIDSKDLKLLKKDFTSKTNISKFDLIIGKEPCAATEAIIERCETAPKSLLISPCKCYDLLPVWCEYGDNPLNDWYNYVKHGVKYLAGDFNVYTLDESMHYDNPIYTKVLKK